MKLLIFDTETTGLPHMKVPAILEPNNWPHIVSISWIILDTDTNKIEKERYYIVYPLWEIPEESTKIHKITTDYARMVGRPLQEVMNEFLIEKYDALVAHNMEFDLNVIYNAIRWDLGDHRFYGLNVPTLCTMKLSRDICMLASKDSKYGYKHPKLMELYEFTFSHPPEDSNLHNSLYDTKILTEIIQKCKPLRSKMNLTN